MSDAIIMKYNDKNHQTFEPDANIWDSPGSSSLIGNSEANQDNVTVACNNFSLSDEQLMQNNIYDQHHSQKFLNKLHKIKIDTIKSPISKLYEVMAMMNKPLDFKVVSVEGKLHCLNFVMEVRSDKLMAIGKGSSIKKAKKEASIALLENIYSNFSNDTLMSTTPNHSPSPLNENNRVNIQTPFENTHKDPICQLQELCMSNHWPMPNYEYFHRIDQLNNIYFVVECTLMDLKSEATSKSKKTGKKLVAQLMFNRITKLLITKTDDIKCLVLNKMTFDENDTNNLSKLCTSIIENRIGISNLKLSKNSGIKTLKNMNADALYFMNAFELLSQISNEESFIVSSTVVSQKTINVIVLIEVYLQPVVTNVGDGKSVEEAKECCARTVLLYFKQFL